MAVLDILPNCVSSVYFMYDKAWEKHSLGKVSRVSSPDFTIIIKNDVAQRFARGVSS
jgi:arginyl-tRNA--protein-N-Asp/Glu arginylyltransferase